MANRASGYRHGLYIAAVTGIPSESSLDAGSRASTRPGSISKDQIVSAVWGEVGHAPRSVVPRTRQDTATIYTQKYDLAKLAQEELFLYIVIEDVDHPPS
jgi:hypothetical protein